ncbi:MAG: pseudouridine synthase [Sphingobium sp.]
MKPPRKPSRPSSPTRPSSQGPRRPRPGEEAAPKRLSPAQQARRVADNWGVSPDEPSAKKGGKQAGKQIPPAPAPGKDGPRRQGRNAPSGAAADHAPGATSTRKGGTGRSAEDKGRPERAPGKRPASRAPYGRAAFPGTRAGTDIGADASSPRPVRKPRSAAPTPVHRIKAAGEPQRIAKLLARAGVASRREIERMIAEGRIAVDGAVLDTPATLLDSLSGVTVDGQPVAAAEAARLFLFHKPSGCLTTERDPAGRPTIYDRLPAGLPRLMPVGRLDMTTEGLLLLTNDGELKRKLELPSSGVERTYRARAFGEISQAQLEDLIEGIEIDGIRYGRIDANLERRTGRNQWIEMTLTEGKNREVRRVLEHLGLTVNRLIRVRYGPFDLADSTPGELVEIKRGDMDRFLHYLKDRDPRRRDRKEQD